MKILFSKQGSHALTQFEVLVCVIIVITLFLLMMVLPYFLAIHAESRRRAQSINCVNNLKQLSVASRIWETDTANEFISTSTSSVAGLTPGQNAWVNFISVSNLPASSKFLHCPADTETQAISTPDIKISYFLNLDKRKAWPQKVLFGDGNLTAGNKVVGLTRPVDSMGVPGDADIPLKSGVWEFSTNMPLSWTVDRHGYFFGNVAFGDGHVAQTFGYSFDQALQQAGLVTNRLAIP